MYNEIRSLKIEKNNIVQSEELKNLICEMESLSDKKCDRYKELKKLYDKQISSAFLKQGELVESGYWEAYLKTKTPEEIEKNIKTLDE